MNPDEAHQMELDERRRLEDELIARARKKKPYYRRVLRDWGEAFDNRRERHARKNQG